MGPGDLLQLGGALLSGSALPFAASFLWRRLRRDPRNEAEARKLNAEASHVEWQTLRDEIDRLTATVRIQGRCIAELEAKAEARIGREEALAHENKLLRAEVGRLRNRVKELEDVLKLRATPKDMRRQLEKIDRNSAKPKESDA